MTDKPIIFSGPMVRAILEGRKTQTRLVMPAQSLINSSGQIWAGFMGWQRIEWAIENRGACGRGVMPKYWIGDRLWVREAWRAEAVYDDVPPRDIDADACMVRYEADGAWSDHDPMTHAGRPRRARHMPRWASRLTLIVEDVRVQRLQEISGVDAFEEGFNYRRADGELCHRGDHPSYTLIEFRDLWDSLNAKRGYGWDANPWVVALTFRPIHSNIDALQSEAAE